MNGGLKLTHILLLIFAFFVLWLPEGYYEKLAQHFMSEEQKQALVLRDFARSVGETCDYTAQCKQMMQINCPATDGDGVTYFHNSETLEHLVTCGEGAACPPAGWDCEAPKILAGIHVAPTEINAAPGQLPDPADVIIPSPIHVPGAPIPVVEDGSTPRVKEPVVPDEMQAQ